MLVFTPKVGFFFGFILWVLAFILYRPFFGPIAIVLEKNSIFVGFPQIGCGERVEEMRSMFRNMWPLLMLWLSIGWGLSSVERCEPSADSSSQSLLCSLDANDICRHYASEGHTRTSVLPNSITHLSAPCTSARTQLLRNRWSMGGVGAPSRVAIRVVAAAAEQDFCPTTCLPVCAHRAADYFVYALRHIII